MNPVNLIMRVMLRISFWFYLCSSFPATRFQPETLLHRNEINTEHGLFESSSRISH